MAEKRRGLTRDEKYWYFGVTGYRGNEIELVYYRNAGD
jgi:hypothetical protein